MSPNYVKQGYQIGQVFFFFCVCVCQVESSEGCHLDYLKVYDGPGVESPLMESLCGSRRNVTLVSSGEEVCIPYPTGLLNLQT